MSKHMNVVMLAVQKVTHEPLGERERERERHTTLHTQNQRETFFYNIPPIKQMHFVHLRICGVADKHTQHQPEYRLHGPQHLQLLLRLQLCNVHHL